MSTDTIKKRRIMLIFGVFSMIFAGIIYAWSILKSPLSTELLIKDSALALNFTLTMCFFCVGGLLGSFLSKRIGVCPSIIISGCVAGLGFALTGIFISESPLPLYFTYALMAGGGIGVVYNVIISSVSLWFPDKKGLCSGALMMGFGASTLLLGNITSTLFDTQAIGWRITYVILGVALAIALTLAGLVIKRPTAEDTLPEAKVKTADSEDFEKVDFTPVEMLKRFSFWRAFILLVCLTAVGSSVISFARDLAISVGAGKGLATTLVGVLSVCNGLGRILTGKCFDLLGRRKTMLAANIITVFAAGVTLLSVYLSSLPLCIIGLCLTGLSYGSSPTVSSAFTSAFYGTKHFPTNFSIMNFNLTLASFVATACSALLDLGNGYTAPFILLLILSGVALIMNFSIKKP